MLSGSPDLARCSTAGPRMVKWVAIVWYVVQVVMQALSLNETRLLGVRASQTQLIRGKKSAKEVAGKQNKTTRNEPTGPQISVFVPSTEICHEKAEFPQSLWAQAKYSPLALILYELLLLHWLFFNFTSVIDEMQHDGPESLHVSFSSWFPKHVSQADRQTFISRKLLFSPDIVNSFLQ